MPDRFSWTELHAKVHRTLRQRGILGREQAVLVAVSGGQDSLCLLRLLCDLQPKWGWRLGVAHCDHRWRLDSSANARHVEQLAKLWALPFYGQVADRALASEALARQWRYETLAAIAHQHNYTHVATGHTASDRAETLLYNLMRGSGTDGLQALTWQRPLSTGVTLVRPLLEVSRAETAQFCQNGQLPIWEDSTNQNLKYARNRIRNQLLPYLRSHFNPQVEQHLGQTAEILQADVEYLETAAQNLLQQATAVNEYKIQQGEWGTGNGQQGTGNRELNQKSKIQNKIKSFNFTSCSSGPATAGDSEISAAGTSLRAQFCSGRKMHRLDPGPQSIAYRSIPRRRDRNRSRGMDTVRGNGEWGTGNRERRIEDYFENLAKQGFQNNLLCRSSTKK